MEKLLIIDDAEPIRKQLRWGLGRDFRVLTACRTDEALSIFRAHRPRVITLDLGLPPDADGVSEGFRCLQQILQQSPTTKIVVLTGNDERENALRAVGMGAYDYYQKPIDLQELKIILSRAIHVTALEEENRRLHSALDEGRADLLGIHGHCPQMQEICRMVHKVASSDVPVLVLGESGTGKELIARAIHKLSFRQKKPFVPINCGAIPENLLESELFGHEKGAFTGAQLRVQGKVEFAHNGTLFLDEIAELSPPLQVKLLRFLQEKTVQRVGGREDIPVDARIVAATNADISQAILKGTFREDLYYRLGVVVIQLPPLRERGEDVLLLGQFFLGRYGEEMKKKIRGFSATAVDLLKSHSWPGNVRELENRIKRGVILSDSPVIGPEELGFQVEGRSRRAQTDEELTLREARDRVESEMVISAIQRNAGNIAKAAESLGVSRPTIYDLMKKHGFHRLE